MLPDVGDVILVTRNSKGSFYHGSKNEKIPFIAVLFIGATLNLILGLFGEVSNNKRGNSKLKSIIMYVLDALYGSYD